MIRPFGAALLALTAFACTPEIGDDCNTSQDCSALGDRLCDTTQPNGYCTIFNCEPDTCPPGEGVCVAFGNDLDPSCRATDDGKWARFERTFCLLGCEDDGDCREEYECVAPSTENSFLIVDLEPEQGKVCVPRSSQRPASLPSKAPEVCSPGEGGAPLVPYEPGTTGGFGGGGGAGGNGGQAAQGGAGNGGAGGAGGAGGGMGGAGGAGGSGGAGGLGGAAGG